MARSRGPWLDCGGWFHVDHHVARWAAFWKDDPAFVPEVEGALVRMGQILRHMRRVDAVAFADAADFTMEDYRTPHALMVQPYPTEASPAQWPRRPT